MTLNPDAAGEIQINVDLNVTNHSDEDQANVDITVKLYDQDGLQVGSDIINLPIPNIVTKSSDISAVNQTIQLNQGSYVLRAIAENMGEEIETANNSTEVWITVIEKQQEVNIPGLNPILIVVLGFAVVYVLKTTKH